MHYFQVHIDLFVVGKRLKLNNIVLTITMVIAFMSGIFYFYRSETPTSKPFIAELDQRSKNIKLTLDAPIYSGEKSWLAVMFNRADNNEDHVKKQKMFQHVIASALAANDFNVALMAVLRMGKQEGVSHDGIIKMLNLIVDKAIQTTNLDYAYFAVNQYPTCYSKAIVESKVTEAYAKSIKNINISVINKNSL